MESKELDSRDLRQKRRAADLTQKQLGELVGRSQGWVNQVESGRIQPSLALFQFLSDVIASGIPRQYDNVYNKSGSRDWRHHERIVSAQCFLVSNPTCTVTEMAAHIALNEEKLPTVATWIRRRYQDIGGTAFILKKGRGRISGRFERR